MVVFAAMSFYWALGGTAGINTVSLGQELAGKPWFITVLWLTGMLKLGGGVLALALVQSWGKLLPRRGVLIAAWGVSALLVFHGSDFIIQGALTENGLIDLPAPAVWTATHWQTFMWGPWWLLGGIAFCVATWNYQQRSR
ncbi:DUF3995 domain-containing protein (plasmid) [Haladaptatus sp. SPP-AMP-3]|uniref:DUF3995 domain-containing protein n=1 Tax=Haladaptatus sp. SPP-AMP-3 TaxID=3121295 RepID=UPI003C30B70B